MNILLINQYYPPDSAPTGQYLHDLAKALVLRGHTVTVICSRRAYNGTELYPPDERMDGVRVLRVRATGFGRRSGLGKLVDYGTFYLALSARLLAPGSKPDVVLALTTPPHVGLLAAAASWRHGAVHTHWVMDIYPDVLAAHGLLQADQRRYRLLAALTRRELRGSPLVLCLGDDMARRLRRYSSGAPDPVVAVPLWIHPDLAPWPAGDPPRFRAEQGWGPDDVVLMYSGNMGRGHRLGEFLAAAARFKDDRSIHWVFAGGGKRRGEVEAALANDPALNLRLLPYAPSDRLREHLCSADVHLASLDAQWQGCMVPSKLQGIFAVGKPLIFVGGRDNAPAQWVEESGAGWVIPGNDVDALCAAVESARDARERTRRGAAARAFAERTFDRATNLDILCTRIEGCVRRS
ncbi:MAG TPA: glycosyltransferase family 4 protein [Kiritimatiellia bacterium]|nr:glycosyltransferase family 4 protein [Kiritimatiellia bacterium]